MSHFRQKPDESLSVNYSKHSTPNHSTVSINQLGVLYWVFRSEFCISNHLQKLITRHILVFGSFIWCRRLFTQAHVFRVSRLNTRYLAFSEIALAICRRNTVHLSLVYMVWYFCTTCDFVHVMVCQLVTVASSCLFLRLACTTYPLLLLMTKIYEISMSLKRCASPLERTESK